MGFRTGRFERSKTGILRHFCPAHAVAAITEINLDELKADGKELILLDVDHTLVKWKKEDFSPEVMAWLDKAKQLGFKLCILSNTRRVERLARLSSFLGIETLRGRFKPSTEMYHMALSKFGVQPERAIMIGDQIMTDILGANRAGIDAIWVQKMEGPEFAGTKFNRVIETILTSFLYRSLVTPMDEPEVPGVGFFDKPIVRQFVKFCMVGGMSFVIDYGIRYLMLFKLKSGDVLISEIYGKMIRDSIHLSFWNPADNNKAFFPVAAVTASFIATFNSFLLNRAFTFRVKEKKDVGKQAVKVYLVSYVGLAINAVISTFFNNIIPGHAIRSSFIATVIGAAAAAIWNFTGQRTFAFKVHKREE